MPDELIQKLRRFFTCLHLAKMMIPQHIVLSEDEAKCVAINSWEVSKFLVMIQEFQETLEVAQKPPVKFDS